MTQQPCSWGKPSVVVVSMVMALAAIGCGQSPTSSEHWKEHYSRHMQAANLSGRKARDMLREKLAQEKPGSELHEFAAWEAYARDLNPLAYSSLAQLLERRPGDVKLQRLMGRILREEGFLSESEAHLAHQLSLKPDNAGLLSELLRTHVVAHSLDKADQLLRAAQISDKCPAFYGIAARIEEIKGDSLAAFNSLFSSLRDRNYSLGSSCFRDLARLSRELRRPLMDHHFYALYRPNASPDDVEHVYSDMSLGETHRITDATLTVSPLNHKSLRFMHHISIAVDDALSELFIPILLPFGEPGHSKLTVAPHRDFKMSQLTDGKTRIHHLVFDSPLPAPSEINLEITFEEPAHFQSNHPWIWERIPSIYPCKVYVSTTRDFGVDISSMVRESQEEGTPFKVLRTTSGAEIRPDIRQMFFMPSVSFAHEPALLYLANKIASIATFLTLIALCAALMMHYKASRGVGWAMLIFSACYAAPLFFDLIPKSRALDIPEFILGHVFSPEQQFPQTLLAASLASLLFALSVFATWLMATHRDDFTVPGERMLLLYVPVMFPLVPAAYGCFSGARLITDNIGWRLATYLYGFDFVLLCVLFLLLLRQSRTKVEWPLIVGCGIGILLAECTAHRLPQLRVVSQVVFSVCATGFLLNIWIHYRRIRGKLPATVSRTGSLVERLQLSVSSVLDRYAVLIRVAAIISGVAVFLSTLITILRSAK